MIARPSSTAVLINTFVLSLLLIVIAGCSKDATTSTDPSGDGTPTVSMPGNTFSPFTTTIDVGKSVIFDFPSFAHNVIFQKKTGAPADIQSTSNQKVSRTFNTVGTFPYDCTLHPGMSGQVIVR